MAIQGQTKIAFPQKPPFPLIQREEVPQGVSMATWALAWCLRHPAVSCVIPGCKSVEQVESNAAAAELEMVRGE